MTEAILIAMMFGFPLLGIAVVNPIDAGRSIGRRFRR